MVFEVLIFRAPKSNGLCSGLPGRRQCLSLRVGINLGHFACAARPLGPSVLNMLVWGVRARGTCSPSPQQPPNIGRDFRGPDFTKYKGTCFLSSFFRIRLVTKVGLCFSYQFCLFFLNFTHILDLELHHVLERRVDRLLSLFPQMRLLKMIKYCFSI
jgi:hypothetical protein